MNLKDRVALITGASRGIGAATAKAMATKGAHVILLARTQGALEEVDDEIRAAGGKATLIPLDLMKLDKIDKLGPSVRERFGRLDIFFGNAGLLGPLMPAHQIDPKDWQKVMVTNFTANTRLVRTFDPLLRASDTGYAVFTGAASLVKKAPAYWGAYTASKAALDGFVRSYAAETKKTGLRVNLIDPGVVDTALLKEAFPGGYPGKTRKPDEIAEKLLPLLSPGFEKHGEVIEV